MTCCCITSVHTARPECDSVVRPAGKREMVMRLSVLLMGCRSVAESLHHYHEINHKTQGAEAHRQCGKVGVLCTHNDLE